MILILFLQHRNPVNIKTVPFLRLPPVILHYTAGCGIVDIKTVKLELIKKTDLLHKLVCVGGITHFFEFMVLVQLLRLAKFAKSFIPFTPKMSFYHFWWNVI